MSGVAEFRLGETWPSSGFDSKYRDVHFLTGLVMGGSGDTDSRLASVLLDAEFDRSSAVSPDLLVMADGDSDRGAAPNGENISLWSINGKASTSVEPSNSATIALPATGGGETAEAVGRLKNVDVACWLWYV